MSAVNATQVTLAVDLGALLDAGDGAFVTLEAGETQVGVHKAVLAARSPVFQAMFRHDTLEASSGVVRIADMEGPVLRQLISYCYSLQAPQLPAMATQLLAAADRYGLSDLKAACEQQLAAQLDVENAAASVVLAVRHSCPNLTAAAIAFINAHFQVMATQGWAAAVKNQPDDLIQVSRLLAEPPAKTSASTSVTVGGTPASKRARMTSSIHKEVSQTAASAATPPPPRHTLPPHDAAVARFWSLSGEEKGEKLAVAALCGSEADLRALLAAGADVRARDSNGWTALHVAAQFRQEKAARLLVEAGAEVGARDRWRATPLHLATDSGRTGVVRCLVAHSADVDARDGSQKTPLHWAAECGHEQVVAALLDAGADARATDMWGNTPLDDASHQEVINLLHEASTRRKN